MATKITLTITPDTEYLASDEIDTAMLRTITALQRLGPDAPLCKFVLNFECKDEEAEDVKAQIHVALSARPVGIDALLKTTSEERVTRETMPRSTPMDTIEGFAERYGAKVEFVVSSDRSHSRDRETN